MDKTCTNPECGKTFTASHRASKYCGDQCRERAKYLRMKSDPERYAAYLARLRNQYAAQNADADTKPTRTETCQADGCDRPTYSRNLCRPHYSKQNRSTAPRCDVDGCDRPRHAHGQCKMHVRIWKKANGTWKPSPSDRWDDPRRVAHNEKRKAIKRGATEVDAESFDRREIFERDEFVCHLCGLHIDPTLKYPDPKSASLDHVLPLSKGGAHTRANAAAAHLDCNVRRRDMDLCEYIGTHEVRSHTELLE